MQTGKENRELKEIQIEKAELKLVWFTDGMII